MNICIIVGGHPHHRRPAIEYGRHLSRMGINVDFIGPTPKNDSVFTELERCNYIHISGPGVLTLRQGLSLSYVRRILRILQAKSYDVVLVHFFRGCGLLPIMANAHAQGWLTDIRSGNVSQVGTKATLANIFTRLEATRYDEILTHSKEYGRHILGDKVHVSSVSIGADTSLFLNGQRDSTRGELGVANHDRVIVYMGELDRQRHPLRMLETFDLLSSDYPSLKFLILGRKEIPVEISEWIIEHSLTERIICRHDVPHQEIPNYLAAADIGFAYMPDSPNFAQNPALKTIEFLAAGLPIVATDTPGNRSFITNNQNGLLTTNHPESMAQTIKNLLNKEDLCQYLARNAQLSSMQFDWKTIVQDQLLPILRKYVDHKRP